MTKKLAEIRGKLRSVWPEDAFGIEHFTDPSVLIDIYFPLAAG